PITLLLVAYATRTTPTSTLSLHDALPIWRQPPWLALRLPASLFFPISRVSISRPLLCSSSHPVSHLRAAREQVQALYSADRGLRDRKSTRLNSSHVKISYAVFCLKKNMQA